MAPPPPYLILNQKRSCSKFYIFKAALQHELNLAAISADGGEMDHVFVLKSILVKQCGGGGLKLNDNEKFKLLQQRQNDSELKNHLKKITVNRMDGNIDKIEFKTTARFSRFRDSPLGIH